MLLTHTNVQPVRSEKVVWQVWKVVKSSRLDTARGYGDDGLDAHGPRAYQLSRSQFYPGSTVPRGLLLVTQEYKVKQTNTTNRRTKPVIPTALTRWHSSELDTHSKTTTFNRLHHTVPTKGARVPCTFPRR